MIKSFNPIKSRRPWPPISISHLFQQGPFSSWPLLFLHLRYFCLDLSYNGSSGNGCQAIFLWLLDDGNVAILANILYLPYKMDF